jgi:hypothetical protein
MSSKNETDRSEAEILSEASRLFTTVRDIPYILGVDGNPANLLTQKLGNCTRKHLFLAPKLAQLGFDVGLHVATFDWRDLPIPKEITSLSADPTDTHLFLTATRNGEQMIVDATWDSDMPEGFAINDWDGTNQTALGVPALSVTTVSYQALYSRVMVGSVARYFRGSTPELGPFSQAFNSWIARSIE